MLKSKENYFHSQHDKFKLIEALVRSSGITLFDLQAPFLAGGSIRDALRDCEPNDYDLYFNYQTQLDRFVEYFKENITLKSNSATTIQIGKMKIQAVHNIGTIDSILKTFDFNINQVAYSLGDNKLYYYNEEDLYTRHLKSATPRTTLTLIPRLVKFLGSGRFLITKEETLSLLEKVRVAVEANDDDTKLNNQLKPLNNEGYGYGEKK